MKGEGLSLGTGVSFGGRGLAKPHLGEAEAPGLVKRNLIFWSFLQHRWFCHTAFWGLLDKMAA